MIVTKMTKLMIAAALTLAVTVGSGVVADEIGLSVTPTVYACSHGSGGGC